MKEHTYSKSVYRKKIAIFGIMPPPLGGVSVHVQRVSDLFSWQHNKVCFFNTEQRVRKIFPWYLIRLIGWLFKNRPDSVYYHSTYLSSSYYELCVLLCARFFFRYQLILVDHDCRHLERAGRWKNWLYRWIARKIDHMVCIGTTTWKSYKDNNVIPRAYSVESAFIPPAKQSALAIQETYPSSLTIFIQDHTPLFLLSAAHLMCINTNDVYGIDTTIKMLAQIKKGYPDAGLIIGLPRIGNALYYENVQQMMRDYQVAEQIFFLHGNKELWPLFESIDIFLRPTTTDGDSISVQEALYFKTPIVASNAAERPEGVFIYDRSTPYGYAERVEQILQEQIYAHPRKRHHVYEKSSF